MNKWNILGIFNFIFSLINISVFIFLLNIIEARIFDISEIFSESIIIDGIAIHLNILTACITFVTIILAVAGIIGYNGIKSSSEKIASDKAMEVVNQKWADFISSQSLPTNDLISQPDNIDKNITPASGTVTGATI
jgi:hypothetical protein